jgi:hypothetical protein
MSQIYISKQSSDIPIFRTMLKMKKLDHLTDEGCKLGPVFN